MDVLLVAGETRKHFTGRLFSGKPSTTAGGSVKFSTTWLLPCYLVSKFVWGDAATDRKSLSR